MTHVQEVVGSNPGNRILDGHDIFHIEMLLKLYFLLKKTENKRKNASPRLCLEMQKTKVNED